VLRYSSVLHSWIGIAGTSGRVEVIFSLAG
jgi:hypothetical protein